MPVAARARRLAPRDDEFPEPEWYASPESALEAAQGPGMFNIIHNLRG